MQNYELLLSPEVNQLAWRLVNVFSSSLYSQITKHLSTGIERKSCASFRYQTDSQDEKDDVYADIRESYFTNTQRGTYKYIDPEFKGRNTYRELKLQSARRGRNKDGRNRNGRDRDKLQALNSFCARNLQDVDKSKSEEILTEWALLKIYICGQKLDCLYTHEGMNCSSSNIFKNLIMNT